MNISVDLDGVLKELDNFRVQAGSAYCKKTGVGSFIKYDYETRVMFGWTKEFDDAFWDSVVWDYVKLPAFPAAAKIIGKLRRQGHKIIINTSRQHSERDDEVGMHMRAYTAWWLKQNGIEHDELEFCRGDKLNIVRKYCCGCHIEDRPSDIESVLHYAPVIVYHSYCNKHISGENIYRARNWNEIYKLVQKIDKLRNKQRKSFWNKQ